MIIKKKLFVLLVSTLFYCNEDVSEKNPIKIQKVIEFENGFISKKYFNTGYRSIFFNLVVIYKSNNTIKEDVIQKFELNETADVDFKSKLEGDTVFLYYKNDAFKPKKNNHLKAGKIITFKKVDNYIWEISP
jgi:hypothetical protein